MKQVLSALLLINGFGLADTALATPQICPVVPPEQWMATQQVEGLARNLGYDKVYFVQPSGGCWKAFVEKQGSRVELFFNPATGELVRTEYGS